MPKNSSAIKRRAVEGYGGRVILCEPTQADREHTAAEVVAEIGGTLIPPYNHPDIIAGQGTVALELLDQAADLDAIVAPIGGGGLVSGICIAAHSPLPLGEGQGVRAEHAAQANVARDRSTSSLPSPQPSPRGGGGVRVFAAEPSGADDAARSKLAGYLIPQTAPKTIADGLLTSLGDLTWPIVRDHVERVLTVSDDRIAAAMRLVFERMKLVIEPSAATAVAAVLSSDFKATTGVSRVGVVLSGGNVDLDRLPWHQ
jgi:threonine dehydratase/serine racemase